MRFRPFRTLYGSEWETAWEIDTYGYYVYRSETDRFEDAELIAYRPGSGTGRRAARGICSRTGVAHGATYHYWLVDVETDGGRSRYGPSR